MKVTGFIVGMMTPHFHSDPAQNFSSAITIAIENRSQINQTLLKKFQPDLA